MRLDRRSPGEIVIPSRLIGSLWLRSLSWRLGRMKRENRIMVDGGRVAGRSGEIVFGVSKRQMLFLGPLWCLTGDRDGFGVATAKTQSEMETGPRCRHTQAHTCKCRLTHTVLCLKTWNQWNTCYPSLFVGRFPPRLWDLAWSLSLFHLLCLKCTTDRVKLQWINVNESIYFLCLLLQAVPPSRVIVHQSLSEKGECRRTGHEPALCSLHHASTRGQRPAPFSL